ncbi:MAG: gas vesicle protein [Jatrophihabitantaceae bacterium]
MTLPNSARYDSPSRSADSLADILERVLDKGIVIAGDVVVNVLDIELLTLKLRLLVASVDTAKQMGIDWWQDDPFLSRDARSLQQENLQLRQRLDELQAGAQPVGSGQPDVGGEPR